MSFEGENLYGQYIDYSEKKWPKGFICPYTGTFFYNIRICCRSQVSVYRTIGPLFFVVFFVMLLVCIIFSVFSILPLHRPPQSVRPTIHKTHPVPRHF